MQLEIKEEKVHITSPEDFQGFANEYKHLYSQFIEQFKNP